MGDDTTWASSLSTIADVSFRITSGRDYLEEFIQFILDNYDKLPLLLVFLHGPPDDRRRLPGERAYV